MNVPPALSGDPGVSTPITAGQRTRRLLELIRFSHTIFALPFACLAALLALRLPLADGTQVTITWWTAIGLILCMVFARSAAMAFNRLVDQTYDAANPRTAGRHLPAGLLSRAEVIGFTLFCAVGFIASCGLFLPNWLPLAASVPVLIFLCGYSLAKRFTSLAHLWLGIALSLAPICVWVAIRGESLLADPAEWMPSVVLAIAVALWVTGFDIIYACQDEAFDRHVGLRSIPARLGARRALHVAACLHMLMIFALLLLPQTTNGLDLGVLYYGAIGLIAALLIYEHRLVKPDDLQRVNDAFFNVNAVISIVLLIAAGIDCWVI